MRMHLLCHEMDEEWADNNVETIVFNAAGLDRATSKKLDGSHNLFHVRNKGDPVPNLKIPFFLNLKQPELHEDNVFLSFLSDRATNRRVDYNHYWDAHSHPSIFAHEVKGEGSSCPIRGGGGLLLPTLPDPAGTPDAAGEQHPPHPPSLAAAGGRADPLDTLHVNLEKSRVQMTRAKHISKQRFPPVAQQAAQWSKAAPPHRGACQLGPGKLVKRAGSAEGGEEFATSEEADQARAYWRCLRELERARTAEELVHTLDLPDEAAMESGVEAEDGLPVPQLPLDEEADEEGLALPEEDAEDLE